MLSVEEISLIKMYGTERKQVIENLEKILPHFTEEEEEMKELTKGVIRKLAAMTDLDFKRINFNLALDDKEESV